MLKENDGLGVISGRQYRHDSIQMPESMAETSAAHRSINADRINFAAFIIIFSLCIFMTIPYSASHSMINPLVKN